MRDLKQGLATIPERVMAANVVAGIVCQCLGKRRVTTKLFDYFCQTRGVTRCIEKTVDTMDDSIPGTLTVRRHHNGPASHVFQ